jgi:hypothetical protein
MKALALPFLIGGLLLSAGALHAGNPVIVHEWGTFTSLQDENGQAIGGINVDDEPVPDFVYTAGPRRVSALNHNPWTLGLPPYSAYIGKGGTLITTGDPEVTMRLETPVLYIYPPKGEAASSVPPLDVHVDFHGGILSQYYPYATVLGTAADANGPVDLSDQTMSGLYWSNVQLGSIGQQPETDDKVWTTPRETSAAELRVRAMVFDPNANKNVETTQAEHFLFYRGLGHLDSPLKVDTTLRSMSGVAVPASEDRSLVRVAPSNTSADLRNFSDSWLVEIRANGTAAFFQRDLASNSGPTPGVHFEPGWFSLRAGLAFDEGKFSSESLAKLKASMQSALIKAGLYPDEASAMLRTWELSYFKSPGLRFFYIVPRAWVDKTLPLKITGAPVEVTRVMVGRIELISDEQKATLARLATEPYADLGTLKRDAAAILSTSPRFTREEKADFESGTRPLTDLGITLSDSVRDYLSLGRFRDALIVHEEQKHPSDNLARFIRENGLAVAR